MRAPAGLSLLSAARLRVSGSARSARPSPAAVARGNGSSAQPSPAVKARGDAGSVRPSPGAEGGRRRIRWRRPGLWLVLALAAGLFAAAVTAYWVDTVVHPELLLSWYDLNVYNDAGLIARQLPSILYSWQLTVGVKFTYTPFAAMLFAGGSMVPWNVLRWLMTVASVLAVPLTVWLTLGAMGRKGAGRLAATLAVGALALWIEPVLKALYLGQIELLLMLLIVWDLAQPDRRRLKGAAIGLAAGIKLVPLIFIPYLLLAGKVRQAAVATAGFAVTVAVGFIFLPAQSVHWWLTGYFLRPGKTGAIDALVDQSLLALLTRAYGNVQAARPAWLAADLAVGVIGVVAAAMFTRSGKPVQGWVLCALTSVLVSPISWDHHWVWIVAVLAMLAGLAMTAGPLARWLYLMALAAVAVVFGGWPEYYSGPWAFIPHGLLGWFVHPPQVYEVTSLTGIKVLTWNLFVAAGLVMFVVMVAASWRAWRSRRAGTRAAPGLPASASQSADGGGPARPGEPLAAVSPPRSAGA